MIFHPYLLIKLDPCSRREPTRFLHTKNVLVVGIEREIFSLKLINFLRFRTYSKKWPLVKDKKVYHHITFSHFFHCFGYLKRLSSKHKTITIKIKIVQNLCVSSFLGFSLKCLCIVCIKRYFSKIR